MNQAANESEFLRRLRLRDDFPMSAETPSRGTEEESYSFFDRGGDCFALPFITWER